MVEAAHLFLNTAGDRLNLGDEGGRVEAVLGGHGGVGLVHLFSLPLGLLHKLINGATLAGVHYSTHIYTLIEGEWVVIIYT